jgi:hypothetical protein
MGVGHPSPDVEALARELCASEGWDPDERITCEPDLVVRAERCGATGSWTCARWQVYASAAERLAQKRVEAWDVF